MTPAAITPPEYARRLGVKSDAIYAWIRSGELRAVDVSAKRGGKPTWRIPVDAIVAFEESRTTRPAMKARRQRKSQDNVIKFF